MNDEFRINESKIVVHGSDGPGRPGVLPTKEELLRICFDQEVHGFLQVDAYLMDGVEPAIQTNVVYGLMHNPNNPVSIQIAQGATKGEVVRCLLPEVTQVLGRTGTASRSGMADSGPSSQGISWTDFGMAPSRPQRSVGRPCMCRS